MPAPGRRHRPSSRHRGVLIVDNQPRHHRSCLGTRSPFDPIQGAVNAADPGDTIQHPDPAGTVQLLADDVTWDGFTILGVAREPNGPGMYTSPNASGYVIRDTIFQDNGVGLRLATSGDRPSFVCRNRFVANNEFDPTGGYGIVSNERTRQALITYDRFEDHNGGAILFTDAGAGTADVAVTANTALDNTRWDCQDESTGVQNAWTANLGRTSSPADLCAPPPPPTDKPGHGKGRHHKEYREYKKNKQQDPCVCTRHHPRAV